MTIRVWGSTKGGIGKSTCCYNIAVAAKRAGKDVLIVEITVIVIGLIASFYPAKVLTNRFLKKV